MPTLPAGPYAVAGLGRAGRAAIDALCELAGPAAVTAWDGATTRAMQRARRTVESRGVRTFLGRERSPPGWAAARTLVKSPGIAPDHRIVAEARERGAEVIDELELGWRLVRAPVLGVTGTNGKSTVAALAAALLRASGLRVELAGNVEFAPALSEVAAGDQDWTVCEVSSYQLEGCPTFLPDVAVFTNLTLEHMRRHGDMRRYGEAKRRMFVRGERAVARAVVDVEGSFGRALAADVERRGGRVVRIGSSAAAEYAVRRCSWDLRRASFLIGTPTGDVRLETRLPGRYNAHNVAAALALADLLGVDREAAIATIARHPGPPGRFEHVGTGPCDVIVDNAHSVDGVRQFLAAVRAGMGSGRRLTTVLGLGGFPEPAMQPSIGAAARSLSDRLVLTASGFRGQPPLAPLQLLLRGARAARGGRVDVIPDRRRALESVLGEATEADVVVVIGRGQLREMTAGSGGETVPFDDRAVAREALQARRSRLRANARA